MEFIFDRTQAYVDRIKELNEKYINGTITEAELQEWDKDSKGALNVSDLNRIEGNMQEIATLLGITVVTKQWAGNDKTREIDYGRILDNLTSIREALPVLITVPDNPIQPLNGYRKWNDIEKILYNVYEKYKLLQNGYYYVGDEMYVGEEIGDI